MPNRENACARAFHGYVLLLLVICSVQVHAAQAQSRVVNPRFSTSLWLNPLKRSSFVYMGNTYAQPPRSEWLCPDPSKLAPEYDGGFRASLVKGANGRLCYARQTYLNGDWGHSPMEADWRTDFGFDLRPLMLDVQRGYYGASAAESIGALYTNASLTGQGAWNLRLGLSPSIYALYQEDRYFANALHFGPGHGAVTPRDGLHTSSHKYPALEPSAIDLIGASGSDMPTLVNVALAAGYYPESVAIRIIDNGLMAPTNAAMFRASLPFAGADGKPVPFDNELRHPVAYWNARVKSLETVADPLAYDRERLRYNMASFAARLTAPLPVVAIEHVRSTLECPGQPTRELAAPPKSLSVLFQPVVPSCTTVMVVSTARSVNLSGRPTKAKWTVLYPNHRRAVTVEQTGPALYSLSARFDPNLPKSIMPVLFTMSITLEDGREVSSNPAAVTFHENPTRGLWSNEWSGTRLLNLNEVPSCTASRQPVVVAPGDVAQFDMASEDPEGFPTSLYMLEGGVGSFTGKRYRWQTTPGDANKSSGLRVICSDGTGAYSSLTQRVLVGTREPAGRGRLLDDTSATFTDTWKVVPDPLACGGALHASTRTVGARATWNASGLSPGQYAFYASWRPRSNNASVVKILERDQLIAKVRVDQSAWPRVDALVGDCGLEKVSEARISAGSAKITVDITDAGGSPLADAIYLKRIGP